METRTKEFDEHISIVRKERDSAMKALDQARKWADEIVALFERDIPSITEQTDWDCGFFNFGAAKKPGVDYFNPGLLEIDGVLWLVTRRSTHISGSFGMNDLVAFRLEGINPVIGTVVKMRKYQDNQQFEDPRVFLHEGKIYLSCTTFAVFSANRFSYAHQTFSVLDTAWKAARTYEPVFGHNSQDWLGNKQWEKNWLWFIHDGLPAMVYLTKPHTVAMFNSSVNHLQTHVSTETNPLWVHGDPRGGTPPVRVGDEYWTFFHSSVPWISGKRRYNMGAYSFEARPPFRITRMTSLPLISGSKRDIWNDGKPLVVFPCGALLRNGEWLVSLGVNDLACAWIKIPHSDLVELAREVDATSPENKLI